MALRSRENSIETACPTCARGPIPSDAERCPFCNAWLRVAPVEHVVASNNLLGLDELDEANGTQLGGLGVLSSDAEVHPGSMALALGLLGLYAGAAGLGHLPAPGDPRGYFGLGALNLALAAFLLTYPPFARPFVIASAPLQVAAWLYLGRTMLTDPPMLAAALCPLFVLGGVTGSTGPRRRSLVLACVLGLLGYSTTVRLEGRDAPGPHLVSAVAGFDLRLPSGYVPLNRAGQLEAYLPYPNLGRDLATFGFAQPSRGIGGFWSIASPGRAAPGALAHAVAGLLTDDETDVRPAHLELRKLGTLTQFTYEVPLQNGRLASVTTLRLPDERTALLVVAAPPALLDPARQALAGAVSFPAPTSSADRR